MRRGFLILIIAVLVVAGLGVGYLGGVANQQTVTTTVSVSCPTSFSSPPIIIPGSGGSFFVVAVSFHGQWDAVVTTYSALEPSPVYLQQTCGYAGNSTAYVGFPSWNSSGEQSVRVTAYKLASGNGNMTVSIGYGAALRSNSTISPFGSVTAFLGTAP